MPYRAYYYIYINDIIIFNKITEEYVRYIDYILSLLKEINLGINLKKSFFGYPIVQLLGFKVNGLGLYIIAERVKAIFKLKISKILNTLE
ncbi:hypothetical protein QBC44DRAFT_251581 [Cladorrhinum sp. PSN332]|nr:hypothetical protein QBC44DRAFT_251581 [Cladorrhinum sp. PSN332]